MLFRKGSFVSPYVTERPFLHIYQKVSRTESESRTHPKCLQLQLDVFWHWNFLRIFFHCSNSQVIVISAHRYLPGRRQLCA